jgi:hypothetical protein
LLVLATVISITFGAFSPVRLLPADDGLAGNQISEVAAHDQTVAAPDRRSARTLGRVADLASPPPVLVGALAAIALLLLVGNPIGDRSPPRPGAHARRLSRSLRSPPPPVLVACRSAT